MLKTQSRVLGRNCNTLRFLCSEPLSVQFSLWYRGEVALGRNSQEDQQQQIVPFNWVNSNIGGAVVDGRFQLVGKGVCLEHLFMDFRKDFI